MKILAVDPGESNGYARLTLQPDKTITDPAIGTLKRREFYQELAKLVRGIDVIVAESFLVRPKNARLGNFDWNQMPASQVIGALDFLSIQLSIPLVLQPPSIKPI